MSDAVPDEQRKSLKRRDVDSGFAWFVLIGCFVMYMFVAGSFKAYGVLYTEMVEYYSSGFGNTAWISTISSILLFCLAPIANLLCKIYSFRRVTMVGGILLGLGYFLSGFVTKIEYMYLTFLSTGLGYGLTFAPCSTIISYYFDKRRALANGITVSGSGIGAIVLPFLYKYLIEQYGLKGTFWITGAIFANICVAACIFRQPRYLVEERKRQVRAEQITSEQCEFDNGRSMSRKSDEKIAQKNKSPCAALDLRFSLFKNALFTLYVISFTCCQFGYGGGLIIIPSSVKALGYDKTHVALSVTIFGGVEFVARILIEWFADLNIIRRKYIYVASMFICGAWSLVAPLFENFAFVAFYAAVTATFPGSYSSLTSVLLIDVVGLENFAPAFGLLSFSLAIGTVPSQPFIDRKLNHVTFVFNAFCIGVGNLLFYLYGTGCVYILAGVIMLLEPFVNRCSIKINNKKDISIDNQQHSQDDNKPTDSACESDKGSTVTTLTA